MTNLGLYLHIPFCQKKCAYCDFYSAVFTDTLTDKYLEALQREIKQWGGQINRPIDTIYLGGGTPSLLNDRLIPLLDTVKQHFNVRNNAEITLEINPQNNIEEILKNAKAAGVNRLSIGAQSGNNSELEILGRTHSANDTKNAVKVARKLGFNNISLDLMLGLPNSNNQTLCESLDFLLELSPEHISTYILKIEPNTAFERWFDTLNLPSEDEVCDQYLFMCDYLEKEGFSHYEISNFEKGNHKSLHNLKYWECQEYLGIGPSAHSFLDGKRFYYPRDLKSFICGNTPIFDAFGGDYAEKTMLALRLSDGVPIKNLPQNKIELFIKKGFCKIKNGYLSLTNKGMLVSNEIITQLLENSL